VVTSTDVLATLLEEMPLSAEKESSVLVVLKKLGRLRDQEAQRETKVPLAVKNTNNTTNSVYEGRTTTDLLGAKTDTPTKSDAPTSNTGVLVDVLRDLYRAALATTATPNTSGTSVSLVPTCANSSD